MEMVCLVTIEIPSEEKDFCEIFFKGISKMILGLSDFLNEETFSAVFNQFHLKEAEDGKNKHRYSKVL